MGCPNSERNLGRMMRNHDFEARRAWMGRVKRAASRAGGPSWKLHSASPPVRTELPVRPGAFPRFLQCRQKVRFSQAQQEQEGQLMERALLDKAIEGLHLVDNPPFNMHIRGIGAGIRRCGSILRSRTLLCISVMRH